MITVVIWADVEKLTRAKYQDNLENMQVRGNGQQTRLF
jgi:hypothetical protein